MHYTDAKTIRDFRKRLGLTQEHFALAMRVTLSTANRWENGVYGPTHKSREAMNALAATRGIEAPVWHVQED